MHKIIVNSPPIALKRPRFSKQGRVYDSQKPEKQYEMLQISKQWHLGPIPHPIRLEINYYVPIPESWSKKKREYHEGLPCIKRPDVDNYLKFSLDVMNGLVYQDDSQVCDVRVRKEYSTNPRTEIIIEYGKNVVENKYG